MRLMLKIQSDDSTVPPVWLSPGQTLTVGRTDAANLAVPHDLLLSRVHFKIVVESGACCVCDLNSSNGTFLHGERITEAQLGDGDQIHAGETVFVVSIELGSTIAEKAQTQLGGVTATACPAGIFQFQASQPQSPPLNAIRRLAKVVPLSLLVNYSKLGLRPPAEPQPVYLFDWIPMPIVTQLSPVFVSSETPIDAMLPLIEQGWGQDAVVLIFSKSEAAQLIAHLRVATRGMTEATGTPIPKHMFGACYPSMVEPVVSNSDPEFAQFLFSGLDAILVESPATEWSLLAPSHFIRVLEKAGFEVGDLHISKSPSAAASSNSPRNNMSVAEAPNPIEPRPSGVRSFGTTIGMSPVVFSLPSPDYPQTGREEAQLRPDTAVLLDVVAGPLVGQRIPVRLGQSFSVGRVETNDFAFPTDLAMSSRHFQIEFLNNELTVHDLGSRNGTFVNGIACKRAVLSSGDRLIAGDSVFQIRFGVIESEAGSDQFIETVTEIM